MKRKEFEKLLGLFDQNDPGLSYFSGFNNPDTAKKSYNELLFFRNETSGLSKEFSPFFTDRVMGRISQITQSHGLEEYLSMQLSRVLAFGLTAVALVFLTLFLLHGQDGFGTIIGTQTSNDLNFISSLFYEF